MVVGKFGKILTFQAYLKPDKKPGVKLKCLTFGDFQREVTNRTEEHVRIGYKPKVEFGGPELSTMTFTITFSEALGVNPRKQLKKLETCVRKGTTDYFIIGKKKIGKHKYMITRLSEQWEYIIKGGKLVQATGDVEVKEYL